MPGGAWKDLYARKAYLTSRGLNEKDMKLFDTRLDIQDTTVRTSTNQCQMFEVGDPRPSPNPSSLTQSQTKPKLNHRATNKLDSPKAERNPEPNAYSVAAGTPGCRQNHPCTTGTDGCPLAGRPEDSDA